MTNNETYTPTHEKNTIPSGWSSLPINEVFGFIGTSSFSRNDLNYEAEEDSIYYIHYGDIHATYKNAVLDFDTETRIPVLNKEIKPSSHFLKEGDLIIADASEDYEGVGEALEIFNLKDKNALAGLHTFALRDKDNKTVHGYRAYLFKNPEVKKRLKTIATGSKVYGISKGNLEKFKITLPPIPEQQKIANILSTWDKAIVLQQSQIAKKKQYKKAIIKKMLTGEVRFKGFTDEWEKIKLGQIGKIKMCKRVFNNETKNEGDIPFYKIGTFGKIADAFISNELYNNYKTKFSFPKKGDILISAAGTLGRTVVYDGVPAYFQDSNIVWLSHDETKVINEYLFYVYKIIRYDSEGGTIQRLYNSIINNAKFYLPSLKEQQKIASFLFGIDKEINALEKELVALQKQKQGLIQQLLTGKVRVKI